MSLVICIAGKIASGKSSVSRALAECLGWPIASFGDYLRAQLVELGGDPTSRSALQDLGHSYVTTDPSGFVRAVLASAEFTAGEHLVLDGIRHESIFALVRQQVFPSTPRLVFLAADETTRQHRTSHRNAVPDDLANAERHAVEAESLRSLPGLADMTVEGTRPLKEVVSCCLDALESWGVERITMETAINKLSLREFEA